MLYKVKNRIRFFLSNEVSKAVRYELDRKFEQTECERLLNQLLNEYYPKGIVRSLSFDFNKFKSDVLNYIGNMKIGSEVGVYKYSSTTSIPNIYSSLYACMLFSLLGVEIQEKDKTYWINYLDSFQSKEDGLFYDDSLKNNFYNDSDWWGARHLCIHLIVAYNNLNSKPKYEFKFLEKFYNLNLFNDYLNELDIENQITNDYDNRLMNIGALLQYNRDVFNNKFASQSIEFLKKWLLLKLNYKTGLWGKQSIDSPENLSRSIQYYYHLYLILLYDNEIPPFIEKAIDSTLKTQNILGGFGVPLNSSACEDIDSIDILFRYSKISSYRNQDIHSSIIRAIPWILANQNDDGGFVFRRYEGFVYGHEQMSSVANESNMFATWFRILCLAYISKFLGKNDFNIVNTPGLQFIK